MASLADRMMGAARLDVKTYEEVEADQNALGQAMTVVVLSAVAAGIGNSTRMGVNGLICGAMISLIGWFIWALLTWSSAPRSCPRRTRMPTWARCCGPLGSRRARASYAAERGVKFYLHNLSGVIRKGDTQYSAFSPTGVHPDLSKSASGTLRTDMPLSAAGMTIDVVPNPGSKPFVSDPPWWTNGGMGLCFPPYYMAQYSSVFCINSDLYDYTMVEASPGLWRIKLGARLTSKEVGNSRWNASHKVGDRVDFIIKPDNKFIPDSRSDLLREKAASYAKTLNDLQVPWGSYDGSAYHEDHGSWGLRRFSQIFLLINQNHSM